MRTLYIIRGLPGSGKSTLASLIKGVVAIAADDYPDLYRDGIYQQAMAGESHAWCRQRVAMAMNNDEIIALHNTSSNDWEIHPYLELAKRHDYSVAFVHCEGVFLPNGGTTASIHGVPTDRIQKMRDRFQSFQSLLPWLVSGFPKPDKIQDSARKPPGSALI